MNWTAHFFYSNSFFRNYKAFAYAIVQAITDKHRKVYCQCCGTVSYGNLILQTNKENPAKTKIHVMLSKIPTSPSAVLQEKKRLNITYSFQVCLKYPCSDESNVRKKQFFFFFCRSVTPQFFFSTGIVRTNIEKVTWKSTHFLFALHSLWKVTTTGRCFTWRRKNAYIATIFKSLYFFSMSPHTPKTTTKIVHNNKQLCSNKEMNFFP